MLKFIMQKMLKFFPYFFLILFLTGCFNSAEKKMLDRVKSSTINEYSKCVGVNGKVNYEIFKPSDDNGNEFLRIIDIKLSRSDKDIKEVHFQIQVNIDTEYVNEIPSYFGIDGKSQSIFGGAIAMMGFCDISLDSLF